MYKVLIADDERLIRITLKNMIDWAALDCEVIATVKDGIEAYRIIQEVHPEIVITDLKMPGMDGIELISKIKADSKNTQVIVLSNYSDFELVRDAMKAGAFDYLLKVTLDKKDLTSIIEQVKHACGEASVTQNDEGIASIKELQQCMVLTKNDHILGVEEYTKALAQPIFEKFADCYQIAYFRVDNINVLYEGKYHEHSHLQMYLQDLMKESIPNNIMHLSIFISNHSGVLLFQSAEKLRVLNICNSIIRSIYQYLDLRISITLSDVANSLKDFYSTYISVLKAHELRFYQGEGILIQSEGQDEFSDLNMDEIKYHIQIIEAVESMNFERVKELKKEIINFAKERLINPASILEYFIFIFNNIEGKEIIKGMKQSLPFDKITSRVRKCETVDKLEEVIDDSFEEIAKWMKDSTNNRYRDDILQILTYIEDNYHKKLTVKMIADHFEMGESNLSRLFKNETGINLNYFINERKMKKAIELLGDATYKIKDVANAVGIDDQLYFNKVFKKFNQVSPSEYRKKIQNTQSE